MACRKCSECVGMKHHWNADAADSLPPDHEDFAPGDYGCKHCDQRGRECPDCGGDGSVDSGGFQPWGSPIDVGCPTCKGEGVIPIDEQERSEIMHRLHDRSE